MNRQFAKRVKFSIWGEFLKKNFETVLERVQIIDSVNVSYQDHRQKNVSQQKEKQN